MRSGRSILLVEDDAVDQMRVLRAFRDLDIKNRLDIVGDGEAALSFLIGSEHKPGVIMLDLSMPRMNGLEFLRAVKAKRELRKIPVVVLTTSREEIDKCECFDLGAAGYMVKPLDYQEFLDVVDKITRYWVVSELPHDSPQGNPPGSVQEGLWKRAGH